MTPEVLEVVELLDQAGEVADPVVVAVEERLDVQLINDGIFVPRRVGFDHGGRTPSVARDVAVAIAVSRSSPTVEQSKATGNLRQQMRRPSTRPPWIDSPVSSFDPATFGEVDRRCRPSLRRA